MNPTISLNIYPSFPPSSIYPSIHSYFTYSSSCLGILLTVDGATVQLYKVTYIMYTHRHTHTNTHLLEVIAGVTKFVSSTCSSCSSLFLRVEAAILNTTDNNVSITIYLINKR